MPGVEAGSPSAGGLGHGGPTHGGPGSLVGALAAALPGPTWEVDVGALRWLGAAMIGLGVGLPMLPHNPGLPCPLRALTGVPCPACGMTTAVKAALAGHVHTSVAANPFGLVAVLVAVVLVVRPRPRQVSIPLVVLLVGALASWAWELHRFRWV